MGCCKSELKAEPNNFPAYVKECIEKNAQKALINLSESQEFELDKEKIVERLNLEVWQVKDLKLNLLGLAAFLGRSTIFQILHHVGCSLRVTEEILNNQGLSILRLVCWKGYSDILCYFLSILPQDQDLEKIFSAPSLTQNKLNQFNSTAIQLAVKSGHLSIISTVHNTFKERSHLPPELDLEACDEVAGENCALIAVRSGSFPMVKLLHQRFGADFTAINKLGENALKIAAINSRIFPDLNYLQIIAFLVETIGLDLSLNYDQLLDLCTDQEIHEYLKLKGRSLGLKLKSGDCERLASSQQLKHAKENEDVKRFNFMTMYSRNCEERDDSLESSIHPDSAVSAFGCSLLSPHNS